MDSNSITTTGSFQNQTTTSSSPRNQEAEKRRDHKTRDHRRQPYLRL